MALLGIGDVGHVAVRLYRVSQQLVHSMNMVRSREMMRKLESAHFQVTRIPMVAMTPQNLNAWLDGYVWETWETWQAYGE